MCVSFPCPASGRVQGNEASLAAYKHCNKFWLLYNILRHLCDIFWVQGFKATVLHGGKTQDGREQVRGPGQHGGHGMLLRAVEEYGWRAGQGVRLPMSQASHEAGAPWPRALGREAGRIKTHKGHALLRVAS